jgi:transposase
MGGFMKYIGIDLHSNKFNICIIYENNTKKHLAFWLTVSDINDFLKHVDKETFIMVEASTNTFRFVERIKEKAKEVYVANTHKLKLISLVKKKTDRIDAEKLAIFLKMQITSGEQIIAPVHVPKRIIQNLRSLFTTYKLLKKHIASIKNRIHSLYKQELHPFTKEYIFGKKTRKVLRELNIDPVTDFQLDLLFTDLENKEKEIEELKQYLMYIAKPYKKQIEILTSMKGISIFTAIAIIADISEIKRFESSKKLSSYLRSTPGIDISNDTVRNLKTNKFGRKLSITLLSQSINHFRDSNLKLKKWYDKKIEQKKAKGKARMAICRKVFTEIYQMLKREEYHNYRDEQNHLNKIKKYHNFINNYKVEDKYEYFFNKSA